MESDKNKNKSLSKVRDPRDVWCTVLLEKWYSSVDIIEKII